MTEHAAVKKVQEMTAWQKDYRVHPFTCGNDSCSINVRRLDPLVGYEVQHRAALVPTVRGWICQFCDWTQPLFDPCHDSRGLVSPASTALRTATALLTAAVEAGEPLPFQLRHEMREFLATTRGVELP